METESFKTLARKAKTRIKKGFWSECKEDVAAKLRAAKECGIGAGKAEKYLRETVAEKVSGVKEDEFYLRVRALIESEGEVGDAIGRLTDKPYYETLSYEEKQRYTLEISEKYLRALERLRRESEFSALGAKPASD